MRGSFGSGMELGTELWTGLRGSEGRPFVDFEAFYRL